MYAHLSVHSHYSLLDALPQIDPLVDTASNFGMPALALTDRNNMYGAIEFYKAATKKGLKPILGVDADFQIGAQTGHLILLARNHEGYQHLIKLVSSMHLSGGAKPHFTQTDLEKYGDGLLVLIPDTALLAPGADTLIEALVSALGKEFVYARLGWNGGSERQLRTAGVARALGLPLVAADGTYYLKAEDGAPRDVVRRISIPDSTPDGNDRHFISPKDFDERYVEYKDALDNIARVVDACTVVLDLGHWIFPKFDIPAGTSYEAELKKATLTGIPWRGLTESNEVMDRIDYELGIINDKGFAPYFLTVSDLLAYAKRAKILTTTRGSAAGSLVSYLTGITNVNPLEYKLPFERFLNPGRPKAPDIDMDIADDKRDQMVDYVKQKYGEDRVAQIGTFGTMMARAAVRDVARALGYPYGTGDRIAKLIPIGSQGFPMTLEHALEIEEDLRKLYKTDEDAEIIINTARRIEGNARHVSVHAAGVVVSPTQMTDFTPIQLDPKAGKIITQYDMYSLTDEYGGVGLLKFDFLGLKNLSVLADAVDRVQERVRTYVDIERIPMNDQRTFAMLARGETEGVFQLSGGGMTRYLKDLKPTTIHDINAMVALYRPGPMESIPQYIQRKQNPAFVTYPDPRMRDILDRSYGLLVYQEDVLMTAITLAGYSWLEADNLRKAMGKKIPAEMEAQKEKFLTGAQEFGGISSNKAEEIWRLIEPFAAYGFGKAHAASYGKVAYQTAYMKANFPDDYMSSLMSADAGDVETVALHVAECLRLGIKVLPPDVNESFETFAVTAPMVIRFGLNSIKNIGDGVAHMIIAERAEHGPYNTLGDFAVRVGSAVINKKSIESLIKAGALDRFGERAAMLEKTEELASINKRDDTHVDQGALFAASSSVPTVTLSPITTPLTDKLLWEKELLGIYVSGHPIDNHKAVLDKYPRSIYNAIHEDRAGIPLVVGGLVETVKPILTKKGDRMGFVTLADREASIECVVFPEIFAKHKSDLEPGKVALVKGKLSRRNGIPSLIVDKVKGL
ncbi:MAG: DNA polymerase III subunit alpha, partial [Patescibacteria group bacterium]